MGWLVRAPGTVADLERERTALAAFGALAGWLCENPGGLDGTPELAGLLERLAAADSEVRQRLEAILGSAERADALSELAAAMRACPAEVAALARRWDEFVCDSSSTTADRVVRWRGLDGIAAPPHASDSAVTLALSPLAQCGLVFDPFPDLAPDAAPDAAWPPGPWIRASARCAPSTEGQAQVPLWLGTLAAQGGVAGEATVDWFVARTPAGTLADSFAAALGALANPFDLDALCTAFDTRGLLFVCMRGSGAIGLGGSLDVGVARGLPVEATLDLGFHWSLHGDYLLRIWPVLRDGRRALRVDVQRTGERDDRSGVGLTLALSPVLERLRPELARETGGFAGLLAEMQAFVPPSAAIRGDLERGLALRIATPDLAGLLESALGSSAAATAPQRLCRRLELGVDSLTQPWRGALSALAEQATDLAIADLALEQSERLRLCEIARETVADALSALRARFAEALDGLLSDDRRRDSAMRALAETGVKSGDEDRSPAGRLAAVATGGLDRFQEIFSRIALALREASETKLAARWRREQRRSAGTSADLSLLFHPEHGDAARSFRAVLAGSAEDVLRAAGTEPSGPATVLGGAMQRFASVRRESGAELAVLDLRLGGLGLFDAEVNIETDVSGNVRVRARTLTESRRWSPGTVETFRAVNVLDLATARRTRHISLAICLSRARETLEPRAIESFFGGLADPRIGLLPPEWVATALERLSESSAKAEGGELRVWMELEGEAMCRLLRVPAEADPQGPGAAPWLADEDRRAIYESAADALVAGLETTGAQADLNNLRYYLKSRGRDQDLRAALSAMRLPWQRGAFRPDPTAEAVAIDEAQYDRLERMVKRAEALIEAIAAMREVYLANADFARSPEEYLRRQEIIDRAIFFWIKGEPFDRGFAPLFGRDSVGPSLLAFFKAIALLCRDGAARDADTPLLASLVLRANGATRAIMLACPGLPPLPAAVRQTPGDAGPIVPALQGLSADDAAPALPLAARPGPEDAREAPDLAGAEDALPLPRADGSPTPQAADLASASPMPVPVPYSAERRSQPMSDFVFPLRNKIATYHFGAKQFGALRNGGKRVHAGCDLIAPVGTEILAMADGTVVRGPTFFYSGTYYLAVAHDNGIMVRYGEIKQIVPKGVKPGARVKQGQTIAYVGRLESGSSMLHLEMYGNASDHSALTVAGNKYMRRHDLVNPTKYLDDAPALGADGQAEAAEVKQSAVGEASPATAGLPVGQGIVDPAKVTSRLAVRDAPKIVAGAVPRALLAPDSKVEVIRSLRGGIYPFAQRDLWLEVRCGDTTGYVVAHFIRIQEQERPAEPDSASARIDAEAGYVAHIEGGLHLRAEPRREGRSLLLLPKGTAVEILGQEHGGFYDASRNDWLRVRAAAADGREIEGYAAALYIEIGTPRADAGANQPNAHSEMDRWTQALACTDWRGASDKTASQLGTGVRGGVEASQRLAKGDLERVVRIASRFRDASHKLGLPAALLAGLASRESHCGLLLKNGWGDNGNAYGLLQVDKRYHKIQDASGPDGPEHLEQAAGILAGYLSQMLQRPAYAGWEDRYLLQGAVAAYNFGLKNVRSKDRIDQGSAGDDYASDVLARARYYFEHPDLPHFRA